MKCLLVIFLLLTAAAFAQQSATPRYEYDVNDFSGGLNLATDSMNIAPNEAVDLLNMRLDRFGHLHKRYGFQNFTDSLFGTNERIRDILYLTTKDSGDFTIYAGDNYCYYESGWGPSTVTDWSTQRLGYDEGIVDSIVRYGSPSYKTYVFGAGTQWIGAVSVGDAISVVQNNYDILTVLSDTCIEIANWVPIDTGGSFAYNIYKVSHGEVNLSAFDGRLYVADAGAQPWTYDGGRVWNLAVVDTGTVDTMFVHTDTIDAFAFYPYTLGGIHANIVNTDSVGYFDTTYSNGDPLIIADAYILVEFDITGKWTIDNSPFTEHHIFFSEINNAFASFSKLALVKTWTNANCSPYVPYYFNNFSSLSVPLNGQEIDISDNSNQVDHCKLEVTSVKFHHPREGLVSVNSRDIYDPRKNFPVDDYGGLYLVNGKNAQEAGQIFGCHGGYIVADSMASFARGDRYYVLWQLPGPFMAYDNNLIAADTLKIDRIMFSQIIFKDKRLYAIGREFTQKLIRIGWLYGSIENDTINRDRVWYSDIGRFNYINDGMNFDMGGANSSINQSLTLENANQGIFYIRDFIFVVNRESIYRIFGRIAELDAQSGVERIVKNFGIDNPHAVCVYPDNNAYLMNDDGIWRFDGNSISPIEYFKGSPAQALSYKVKDFVEKYRGSRKVVGYFKDEIYFSYPDSDFTLTLFAPTGNFTNWGFGIDAINTQSVAIDSNYFLFALSGDSTLIYRYPAVDSFGAYVYYDQNAWVTIGFAAQYGSGWITFPQDYFTKVLERVYLDLGKGEGSVYFNVYANFADTAIYSDTLDSGVAKKKYRLPATNSAANKPFDYFRVTLDATTNSDLNLFGYKIRVYDGPTTTD